MNLLIVDTETTGLDPNKHSIIQLCAEYHEDGVCKSKFNEYFQGGYTVSLGALKVNRTRLSKVRGDDSNTAELVSIKFVDWLLDLKIGRDTLICGQNVDFDIKFIKAMLEQNGIEDLDSIFPYRKYDTATISAFLSRTNTVDFNSSRVKGGGGLAKLAATLGIDISKYNLHDAAEDVALTAETIYKAEELQKKMVELYNKK